MKTAQEIIDIIREAGAEDITSIRNVLEDGEALLSLGIMDEDQEAVEDAHSSVQVRHSTAFDFAGSLERAAEIVTEGTAFCSPESLAGQYAFEAAKAGDYYDDADDGARADMFEAHLEILAEAGAKFDGGLALLFAKAFQESHDQK